MFEWTKKSNCYCSLEGRNRLDKKSSLSSQKKVWLETRGFCPYFWEVDHPHIWFWKEYPDRCTSFWEGKNCKLTCFACFSSRFTRWKAPSAALESGLKEMILSSWILMHWGSKLAIYHSLVINVMFTLKPGSLSSL